MLRYWIPLPLILASACSEQTAPAPVVTNDTGGTNTVAAVESLPPAQRDAVLFRAIRDAGLACQGVTEAARTSSSATEVEWRARCSDGRSHLVRITRDGTALVVSRPE